jgi:cytochrome oxidase Cu insertion factor (SCO1/SenC/PrrC family)
VRRILRAALAVVALSLGACHGGADPSEPTASAGQELDRTLPPAVTHAQLVDSSGRSLTISSLRGKIVVLSDMMTLCQGTCPLDTVNVVQAARRVHDAGEDHRVVFLSVTIDPARDTQSRLVAYRNQYAPAPANWLALSGSVDSVNRFWDALGVYRKTEPDQPPAPRDWLTGTQLTYDITHSDQVFFLDANGHERFQLDGPPHVAPGTTIPPKLNAFLSAEGRADLAHPDAMSWTVRQELDILGQLLDVKL